SAHKYKDFSDMTWEFPGHCPNRFSCEPCGNESSLYNAFTSITHEKGYAKIVLFASSSHNLNSILATSEKYRLYCSFQNFVRVIHMYFLNGIFHLRQSP